MLSFRDAGRVFACVNDPWPRRAELRFDFDSELARLNVA
jgi:hypothetical protein